MKNNINPINQILQDLGIDTKASQKQQIIDFAVSFAGKLVKKCIQMKPGISITKKIKPEDVKQTYESIKMIRSSQLTEKYEQKRREIITNVSKVMLQEQLASKANTVQLYMNNNLEHMMTNKQYQITFQ